MSQRIIITEPNGVQRTMPLTPRCLTIGRGTDNDLVINYPVTSRYHAQITSDGATYYVTDLNSDNGTYLGNALLAPNQPVVWTPGAPLHIGDVLLQLGQEQSEAQQQLLQQQPGRKERQMTETIAGWSPAFQEEKKSSAVRIWLALLLLFGFLCICSVLGTGGYLYFFGEGWF